MPTLKIKPISAEAFAPFGRLLPLPEVGAPRQDLIDELQNLRPSGRTRLSLTAMNPKTLPLTAVEMERHVSSSQAFVPIDAKSYFVLVAPHGAGGKPDAAKIQAFRVPGTVGINYHADVWHHPMTVLDGPGSFVVLTFVDGTAGDEEFVPLPEPVTIEA